MRAAYCLTTSTVCNPLSCVVTISGGEGGRGSERRPLVGRPHEVGPPVDLRLRRRAAETRAHCFGGPLPDAFEADLVGIAGAHAARRRAENEERLDRLCTIVGEWEQMRSAIFGADQVTCRDIQGVKE